MDYFEDMQNIAKDIFFRFKKKDFSGNRGLAIKNSSYQFLITASLKVGSLIFTMIMARILLPELFGLYSLALSTILIFAAFSELSIGETLVRFASKEIGKGNPSKARAYVSHLAKLKIVLSSLVIFVLLISSRFISESYYHKPIFFAMLAGGLYITFAGIAVMFQSILQAQNNFKPLFYREIIVQAARIIIVPLLVLWALSNSLKNEYVLFLIVLGLSFTYFLASLTLYFSSRKTALLNAQSSKLPPTDKKKVNRFVMISSATILSGVFFGYIDIVLLGYFVSSEYIGYYQAAFSFLSATLPLITFSAALLPVFSRLSRKKLDSALTKTIFVASLLSLFIFLILFLFSKEIILIVFGAEYMASVNILRILSLILLTAPIITIYSTYFNSIGKPGITTKSLVISTIINVILTYALISFFISYNQTFALYGAAIAVIISRVFHIAILLVQKRKLKGKI